ncbi:hypothetical protein [Cellulosimicrobium cellulans]|uniref:hypothetical protein n=1 Tax=Cellulosimicrobium cellulans TaxID=1710 RepID=UPI0028A8EF68|nr:hypothetical protein [Cellulosimicrobium cellulans]
MESERRRVLGTAYRCLHNLLSDVVVPDCARHHYRRALSRLQGLATDKRWVHADDDATEPPARGDSYLGARQAIGELIGLDMPWADLYPVLADVVSGWDDEHVACGDCPAEATTKTFALPLDHYLLYGIARTNLVALARTVSATSLTDYWFALQVLDSVHDPMSRPSAERPATSAKPVHYAAARAAITALCAFDLDNRVVLSIRDVLDREWERDADHATSHPARDRV